MKKISLKCGHSAIVDDLDYDYLNKFKWRAQKGKYTHYISRSTYVNGKKSTILMHRNILNVPKGMEVDHIDGDGCNNQRSNLRIATISQNRAHIVRPSSIKKTSKYRGVSWCKSQNKWTCNIQINKKQIHLGYFMEEIKAAKFYDNAARNNFGEFACPNFSI